jgi:thymidylate synthase (FAD)
MVEFKFHVAMPMFIARQWIRHRTANVNEYSARYSIVQDRFYTPTVDAVRKQSAANRQGGESTFCMESSEDVKTADDFLRYLQAAQGMYDTYLDLTKRGVSRELARIGLPVNVYTEWYWKCDLHNILRFIALRLDSHAQMEIRAYARAMLDLIQPIVPLTVEAWRDYEFESVHLSRLEVEALRSAARAGGITQLGEIDTPNRREQSEWQAKKLLFGL